MKVATKTQKVKTSGVAPSQGFQMEASAKAFAILSDKLYTDKILAIVRELSTNAVESHIMNGNPDTPFKVVLPTRMDGNFSIRDYGTGLTKQEIYDVYTVYFKSTKTDTDKVGGCFGLGSKSPFSYTDNFLVESFKDGVKSIYSCHYNEERIPSITEMGEVATAEPNGLRISFAVRENDHYYFQEVAEKVYPYFDVCPDVNTSITMVDYESKHSTWGIKNDGSGSRVIMGNINYPFPSRNFLNIGGVSDDDVDRIFNVLTANSIDLFFDIGDLQVSVSRENIEETNRNAMAIFNLSKDICAELAKDTLAILDAFDDFHECDRYYTSMANLSKQMVKPYLFKGVRHMTENDRYNRASYNVTGNTYDCSNLSRITKNNMNYIPSKSVEVYERDCGNCDKRIRSYARETLGTFGKIADIEFSSLFNRVHIQYATGRTDYKLASDLPKPVVNRGTRGDFVPVCRFSGRGSVLSEAWDKCTDKPDDILVYAEIKANKWKKPGGVDDWSHTSVISDYISLLGRSGVDIPTIHGIKTSAVTKTLAACKSKPVEFMKWVETKLDALQIKYPVAEYARLSAISNEADKARRDDYMDVLGDVMPLLDHPNTDLEELQQICNDSFVDKRKHEAMHGLYRRIKGQQIDIPKVKSDVTATFRNVDAKYPLLKFVGNDKDWNRVNPVAIAQYINAMEKN